MCAIKERLLRGTAVSAVVSKMVLATVALFRHLVVLFDVIAVTLHTVFSWCFLSKHAQWVSVNFLNSKYLYKNGKVGYLYTKWNAQFLLYEIVSLRSKFLWNF